jgi:hypothetical protein
MSKELQIVEEKINENPLSIVASEQYPITVQEGLKSVSDIISQEKQITDLYPQILAETPISTSQFQDTCVQYEQHFTPHKKLRQAVLEMQDKLNALYTAKTGHKRSVLKLERLKLEIEGLQEELDKCEQLSSDYKRLYISLLEKQVDYEEAQRGVDNSQHLIKDAMLKVVQQQKMVDTYQEKVENSDMSFEESEVYYYVFYFLNDVEKQLRTSGRIDTGTFGAIGQLPDTIRKKVLKGISFIKKKLEDWPEDGDFICKVFENELAPKKTGDGEMEGLNIEDFIGMEPIKILALKEK